ncbi:MAG: hypothetical protein IJQ50_05305, partial [Clostridia bacterium]|nr:hypothetical protein [Clostridia bacterium]
MQDIRFNGNLDYIINNVEFVNVLRNANFTFPYKNGKKKHSLIFVENGEMNYYFTQTKMTKKLSKGDTLFIPKNTPYIATYTTDNSIIKLISFDAISESLPDWMNHVVCKSDDFFPIFIKRFQVKMQTAQYFLLQKYMN